MNNTVSISPKFYFHFIGYFKRLFSSEVKIFIQPCNRTVMLNSLQITIKTKTYVTKVKDTETKGIIKFESKYSSDCFYLL